MDTKQWTGQLAKSGDYVFAKFDVGVTLFHGTGKGKKSMITAMSKDPSINFPRGPAWFGDFATSSSKYDTGGYLAYSLAAPVELFVLTHEGNIRNLILTEASKMFPDEALLAALGRITGLWYNEDSKEVEGKFHRRTDREDDGTFTAWVVAQRYDGYYGGTGSGLAHPEIMLCKPENCLKKLTLPGKGGGFKQFSILK